MIQSNTFSEHKSLPIKKTFFAALWIALIVPLAAYGVASRQANAPVASAAVSSVSQPVTQPQTIARKPAPSDNRIRDMNTLTQISLLAADKDTRVRAVESMNALRRQWSNAIGVPMNDWNVSATAPQNSNKVVVAVRRDLFISNDGGQTFERAVNVLPSIVDTLAVSPADDMTFYAGVDGLGFYASHDNGQTWQSSNTGIQVAPGARLGITAITIQPTNAQNMYIASGLWMGTGMVTFYPLGVLKTTDGGKTWTPVETEAQGEIQYLFLDANTLHIWSEGKHMAYNTD